jgi:hypothetical protein
MIFIKRIGPDPQAGRAQKPCLHGRPGIWEADAGDFASISLDNLGCSILRHSQQKSRKMGDQPKRRVKRRMHKGRRLET